MALVRAVRRPAALVLASALVGTLLGSTAAAAPAAAAGTPACGAEGTPAVVALHNPRFYVDTSLATPLLASYAGYSVRAGESSRAGLWLQLSGFDDGGVPDLVRLAPDQPAAQPLPSLPSGGSSTQYLLMQAAGLTSTPQTHDVTVWQGRPGSGQALCRRSFTYSGVHDTIKALANKVTSISGNGPQGAASLGDAVTVTVQGDTGTLGAGPADDPGVLDYTPAALAGFPAAAWRLERTELELGGATHVDRLYLSGASGGNRSYTARYVFRAIGPSAATTALRPIQYIASGTQVKHTDIGGTHLYSLPSVSPIARTTLAKSVVSPANRLLPVGTSSGASYVATYELVLSNEGASAATVDALTDTLPVGAELVPGSLEQEGAALPATTAGRTLTVQGPLRVPATGSTRITYDVLHATAPGPQVNTAVADFGTVTLDASPSVLEQDPATAEVVVLGQTGPALTDDEATTPAPGRPCASRCSRTTNPPPACRSPSRGRAPLPTGRSSSVPTRS
jgi:uncharacterized repeat protein (TIGR01451 family)